MTKNPLLVLILGCAIGGSVTAAFAMITSIGAVIVAARLNHWYLQTLATRLVTGAGELQLSQRADESVRQMLLGIRKGNTHGGTPPTDATTADVRPTLPKGARLPIFVHDPELRDAIALRSRNRNAAMDILSGGRGLSGGLIHHTIELLADESLGRHAMFALCKVAGAAELTKSPDSLVRALRKIEKARGGCLPAKRYRIPRGGRLRPLHAPISGSSHTRRGTSVLRGQAARNSSTKL